MDILMETSSNLTSFVADGLVRKFMKVIKNSLLNHVAFHFATEMLFLILVHPRDRPFRFVRVS